MKNVAWKLFPDIFNFKRILCQKESEEVSMLIWTKFYGSANTYQIEVVHFKKFQTAIFVNFFLIILLFCNMT